MPIAARLTAGALALAALLFAGPVRTPAAHAADVIPEAVAQLAYATAALGVDHRPHTARVFAYSSPAERGDGQAAALVAVWEAAPSVCWSLGVVVGEPDGASPYLAGLGLEPAERGVCWVAGLTELPVG